MIQLVVLALFLFAIITTIVLVIKKPEMKIKGMRFETFFIGVTTAAFVLIALNLVNLKEAILGDARLNPLGILALFFSMVFISIYLDSTGFFEFCAKIAVRHSGTSARKLFILLYITTSVLTIFTSNDIIILTLTPFIYYLTKRAGLNPVPFLMSEFFSVNTWSMMLYIGNPTNIVISQAFGINFGEYLEWMLIPTIIAGLANFCVLFYLFRNDLSKKIIPENDDFRLKDKIGAIIGFISLTICLITLAFAPDMGIPMWKVSVFFAIILAAIILIRSIFDKNSNLKKTLKHVYIHLPFSIIPFVLSLFILVYALKTYGILAGVSSVFEKITFNNSFFTVMFFGIVSTIAANILNNIPMTICFTYILMGFSNQLVIPAAFATIIGSNLGANLTPLGALAGIMWLRILKKKDFSMSFQDFMRYGSIVTALSLLPCLIWLAISFYL